VATIFAKILCPVDFSDNSIAVLDQAAELARRHDALLYLMHVEFVPMNSPDQLARYANVSAEPSERRLRRIAEDHLAKVRYQILVRSGWPGGVIESVARELDIDLIVIATEGWIGTTHPLGNVAEYVIRASKCPVLSFGFRTAIGAVKKILCPIDFNPNSIAALNFAHRLAQEYGATISLLHVVAAPIGPPEVSSETAPSEWEQDAWGQLQKVAAENLASATTWEIMVRRGDPVPAILEVREKVRADLIVMATHGRTGLTYLLLGSVTTRIVRESPVPVLTMRGRQ
jgi:nucleotide-binding universal stress UspA family protein